MASAAPTSLWYVYGIVPVESTPASMPGGIDDARIQLESHDGIAALVSELDGTLYAPAVLETSSGDVEWLSPRAMAHDRVLTWASDRGPVIPLPMFSLFSSRDAVHSMLLGRAPQLTSALRHVGTGDSREYALRVYRMDAELLDFIMELSPRLAELGAAAAVASPGQRYLLERKLDGEKKVELRSVSHRLVDEFVQKLEPHARETVRRPIPSAKNADAAARGTMVLNAVFLVAKNQLPEFQRTLTELVGRYDGHGFRFDFTGPWPPYHFVGDSGMAHGT